MSSDPSPDATERLSPLTDTLVVAHPVLWVAPEMIPHAQAPVLEVWTSLDEEEAIDVRAHATSVVLAMLSDLASTGQLGDFTWAGDVWGGQRCVDGAFLPQLAISFVAASNELATRYAERLAASESFVDEVQDGHPIASGAFPLLRISSGVVSGVYLLDVEFLLVCSRLYRQRHDLAAWTRDPYTQVAGGARSPIEFAWMKLNGETIDAEGGAIEIIENSKLGISDVPALNAPPSTIARFAASFDGFEEYGSYQAAVDTAEALKRMFMEGADIVGQSTLRELRTALFVEYLLHAADHVDEDYTGILVSAVRAAVEQKRQNQQKLLNSFEGGRRTGPAQTLTNMAVEQLPQADLTSVEELELDERSELAHELLLGKGRLVKEDAVRLLGSLLRETGRASFQRLHSDGPLYTLLLESIEHGVNMNLFDRPGRGVVRAILPDANDYTKEQWRWCLLGVVTHEHIDRDAVVRKAAEHAREQMGLGYERLREGGVIDKGLRSAINSAVRRGEVVRVGSQTIRKGTPAELDAANMKGV